LTKKVDTDQNSRDGNQPDKSRFESRVIDGKAPDISSQPDDWDGFQDPFWNVGQVALWVATRDPKQVDRASDASGALGKNTAASETYGRIAASDAIRRLTRQQLRIAFQQIKQFCVEGTLNTTSQSESISADKWRQLEIIVKDDIPTVVSRNLDVISAAAHTPIDLRFRREEVFRCFPPPDASLYTNIPNEAPRQRSANAAYLVLKRMYPENCIPNHIPDETLARRASQFSGFIISRDDIRRALGKKR
jgi:hypothetical protein